MRESISLLILAACVAGCSQASDAQIEWDHIYTPERLPAEFGWGADVGPSNKAELADGALRLVDASSSDGERNCFSRSWPAAPDRGAIIQAAIRVVQNTDRAGITILAADGVHEDGLTLYPDRIRLHNADLEHSMDTTDDFHAYQVRIGGVNIEVWVDGEMVIDGWGKFTGPAHQNRRVAVLGSISSKAISESYWKDVRYVTYTIPVERVEGAEDVVIYRKEGIYACFPSLTHMPGGRLFANFGTRSRRSHIDNTGGTARMISEDGGYTWEPVDKAPDHPRYTREDGTKFVPHARGWVYVDESELPSIKARNRRWMKARPGTVAYLGDPQVAITHPDGKYETLTLDSPVPGGCMSYHHASSFLRKGDLWMTAIYCATGTDGMTGVWVIRSEDNAETWEVVHVAGPVGDRHGLGEAALCDNGQGEIICVMRSGEGGKHNTHQSFSSDGGKTWSAALDTGIWGYPANVILLSDGRLLCSYGYRRDAMGIRAVLSEDGGHTWDRLNEIVIRADGHGHGGDNGYPISVQMDDGHIFTIYYLNDKDDVTHVAGTHWTLPQGPGQF